MSTWAAFSKKARAALAPTLPRPCPFCLRPVYPDEAWDIDHARPQADAPRYVFDMTNLRPAHTYCNRAAGGRAGAHKRRGIRSW